MAKSSGVAPTKAGGNLDALEVAAPAAFDLATHRRKAVADYQKCAALYADFAQVVYSIVRTCLDRQSIKVHSIEHRAKSLESFGDKAQLPADEDPNRPKYPDPLKQITDLAGVRIITYFLSTEPEVDEIVAGEFEVIEKSDKGELLHQDERLGYNSIHYLVKLRATRCDLPEYARFRDLVAEIQLRTILQHAWAEIEHDIQYKSAVALPSEIRRRFMTLAGLLEMGDREFQAIQDESLRLKEEAREFVAAGRLGEVEITPDALKAYLDRRLGPDGRVADWSYAWELRILRRLGFSDLRQLDEAIANYDDDKISRIVHGSRQGQLTRLDGVLLAAMGDEFIVRHPWASDSNSSWFPQLALGSIARLKATGVEVGSYRPTDPPAAAAKQEADADGRRAGSGLQRT